MNMLLGLFKFAYQAKRKWKIAKFFFRMDSKKKKHTLSCRTDVGLLSIISWKAKQLVGHSQLSESSHD